MHDIVANVKFASFRRRSGLDQDQLIHTRFVYWFIACMHAGALREIPDLGEICQGFFKKKVILT